MTIAIITLAIALVAAIGSLVTVCVAPVDLGRIRRLQQQALCGKHRPVDEL